MDELLDTFVQAIREMMGDMLTASYSGLFDDVNGQIGAITGDVSVVPSKFSNWGAAVDGIVRTISEDVIMPIGILIITALMCYELINAVLEKNAMHEIGSEFIFKWLMRACISVLLLTYTYDISSAVFDLGSEIAVSASKKFTESPTVDTSSLDWKLMIGHYVHDFAPDGDKNGNKLYDFGDEFAHSTGEIIGMALIAWICKLVFLVMWIVIEVTLVGRMIEIFMYLSIAPIPFATLTNREWGNIGTNYIRVLVSLAFQAVFIVMCVGIYGYLIKNLGISVTDDAANVDLSTATLQLLGCSIALLVAIRGTKQFAMSIFNAH
ncbi:MAG: type IV secretion system protein [Lachnospiraceae bacterium]|nr:type IV secretion system protein [Lachnospiraceae bacterium]